MKPLINNLRLQGGSNTKKAKAKSVNNECKMWKDINP